MTEKRKADLDAAMASLSYEIWLAVSQGEPTPYLEVRTIEHEGRRYVLSVLCMDVTDEALRAPKPDVADGQTL